MEGIPEVHGSNFFPTVFDWHTCRICMRNVLVQVIPTLLGTSDVFWHCFIFDGSCYGYAATRTTGPPTTASLVNVCHTVVPGLSFHVINANLKRISETINVYLVVKNVST